MEKRYRAVLEAMDRASVTEVAARYGARSSWVSRV